MSTPVSLELPEGARRATVRTDRGEFAVLDAMPAAGPCELGTALLVPGYTGSKEDFIAILAELAAACCRVVAVDMRGQYQTHGPDDPAAYDLAELGADIAALVRATGAAHLLGHSFGGLVVREAVLGGCSPASLTLLSSGPAALPGQRAEELHAFLGYLDGTPADDLGAKIAELWAVALRPQAESAGVPAPILAFLEQRMLANNPTGHGHDGGATAQGRGQDGLPGRPGDPGLRAVRRGRQRLADKPAGGHGRQAGRGAHLHPRRRAQSQRRGSRHHGARPHHVLERGGDRAAGTARDRPQLTDCGSPRG